MLTEDQLSRGEGLSSESPMKAYTYDGIIWHTCELSDVVRGETIEVVTVPPIRLGGWLARQ